MKKIFALLISLLMLVSMCACTNDKTSIPTAEPTTVVTEAVETTAPVTESVETTESTIEETTEPIVEETVDPTTETVVETTTAPTNG